MALYDHHLVKYERYSESKDASLAKIQGIFFFRNGSAAV
jgi:hypothetical protein